MKTKLPKKNKRGYFRGPKWHWDKEKGVVLNNEKVIVKKLK